MRRDLWLIPAIRVLHTLCILNDRLLNDITCYFDKAVINYISFCKLDVLRKQCSPILIEQNDARLWHLEVSLNILAQSAPQTISIPTFMDLQSVFLSLISIKDILLQHSSYIDYVAYIYVLVWLIHTVRNILHKFRFFDLELLRVFRKKVHSQIMRALSFYLKRRDTRALRNMVTLGCTKRDGSLVLIRASLLQLLACKISTFLLIVFFCRNKHHI